LTISASLLFAQNAFFKLFGMINLMVAVFNFLPLSSFDGFQIRELIITRNIALENIESYNKIFRFVDIILFVILFCVMFVIGNDNFCLLLIPFIMLIGKFEDG
jgi:Zn-dependent protease